MSEGRDDMAPKGDAASPDEAPPTDVDRALLQRKHLQGLLEALIFASDAPIKPGELAKLASAPAKQVKELLGELKQEYATRGMHLDEVAGGWVFRTSPQYAPFVRDLTKQKPVRLTRAQVETLAIIAYRQPITRPEVDDVRGVDSGPVLKLLLERDLVRILGKRDEPGRPLIYGTTGHFLEFFGLKSLKDLPTLREFTELSAESREAFEDELGETPEAGPAAPEEAAEGAPVDTTLDTDPPTDDEPPGEDLESELHAETDADLAAESLDLDAEDLAALQPGHHAARNGPTVARRIDHENALFDEAAAIAESEPPRPSAEEEHGPTEDDEEDERRPVPLKSMRVPRGDRDDPIDDDPPEPEAC